jgi:hypothetical protein
MAGGRRPGVVDHVCMTASGSEEMAGLEARLAGLEQPGEVIQAAGLWMAGRLAAGGFRWLRSRKVLERRAAGRRETISVQPSRWNRTGGPVELQIDSLNVRDSGLRDWRRANQARTVVRGEVQDDWVCRGDMHLLRSWPVPGIPEDGHLFDAHAILTRPQNRVTRLDELCDRLLETAVPWFASTADPGRLAGEVDDLTLAFDALELVELAVSRDEAGQARALVERFVALGPEKRDAFERGKELAYRGERPRWHDPAAMGWSSIVLGLG